MSRNKNLKLLLFEERALFIKTLIIAVTRFETTYYTEIEKNVFCFFSFFAKKQNFWGIFLKIFILGKIFWIFAWIASFVVAIPSSTPWPASSSWSSARSDAGPTSTSTTTARPSVAFRVVRRRSRKSRRRSRSCRRRQRLPRCPHPRRLRRRRLRRHRRRRRGGGTERSAGSWGSGIGGASTGPRGRSTARSWTWGCPSRGSCTSCRSRPWTWSTFRRTCPCREQWSGNEENVD